MTTARFFAGILIGSAVTLPLFGAAQIAVKKALVLNANVIPRSQDAGFFVMLDWEHTTSDTKVSGQEVALLRANDPSGNNWVTIKQAPASGGSVVDTQVTESVPYYYRVRGETLSNSIKVQAVNAPQDLRAVSSVRVNNNQIVTLVWSDTSECERGYIIERALQPQIQEGFTQDVQYWEEISVVPTQTNTYTDRTAKAFGAYTYRVRAFSGAAANRFYSPYATPVNVPE